MNKSVIKTKHPIPTPEDLRHDLVGSDRFTALDARDIQTKLPRITTPSKEKHHQEARTNNEKYKKKFQNSNKYHGHCISVNVIFSEFK